MNYSNNIPTETAATFSSYRHKFDSFAGNEVQSFVDIRNFVKSHFASIGLRKRFTGDNF